MINFKDKVIDIGDIKMRSTDNIVEFTFEGDGRNIEFVRKLCGCTADEAILGHVLQLRYNETITRDVTKEELKSQYPEKYILFDKSVEVYYKDGKDLYVINEVGNKSFNSKKAHDTLTFKGKIIIDD